MLLKFTLLSIYSDLKQDFSCLLQAYCGEKRTLAFKCFFWINLPNSSDHLPLKNPGVLFIIELLTITHLWTQNLLLPFPITYFSLSCTPDAFGIKYRNYHHLTNYIFSYHSLLFLLISQLSPNATLYESGDWSLLSLLYPHCLPAGIARPRYLNEKINVEGMDGEYLSGLKI